MAKVKITLVKSTNSTNRIHRKTVQALGLRKIGQSVEKDDSPVIRGMVRQVSYLVTCEEI
ncbi:MAG: 50S ribosomal protein L30 [Clostridiaceae bacterium]|nr:50S ribosomal protein L30 [Clostridiaceae bacterium]